MRILVTGAAGLIGQALIKQLQTNGIEVIGIDKGVSTNHYDYGDVCDQALLQRHLVNCEGVIHLAGVSRVLWGEQNPQRCWDINVHATRLLLKVLHQIPHHPWIIYASSREVYGQQIKLPVREDATLMPVNAYARSKVAAESLISHYQNMGLKTAILRFSSVYGSIKDHPDRVIPAFCRAALLGDPLRIDGFDNTFDFTHVGDTVRGILCAVAKLCAGSKGLPPIHLTTGQGTSLLQLAQLIECLVKKKLVMHEAPARTYDVQRFIGDTQRAKQLLGWEATTTLAQGISTLLIEYETQTVSA